MSHNCPQSQTQIDFRGVPNVVHRHSWRTEEHDGATIFFQPHAQSRERLDVQNNIRKEWCDLLTFGCANEDLPFKKKEITSDKCNARAIQTHRLIFPRLLFAQTCTQEFFSH